MFYKIYTQSFVLFCKMACLEIRVTEEILWGFNLQPLSKHSQRETGRAVHKILGTYLGI